MNASSLPMVIMSRTMGMLCSITGSEVSNAAAIAGSAEFFAPLIATEPCNRLPPRIRNLSILSLFADCPSQVALRLHKLLARCFRREIPLQHDQCHTQVVFALTQSVFHSRRFFAAPFHQ